MTEDLMQKRSATIVELDLSDLEISTSSETVQVLASPFHHAIEVAANLNRKALAAAESREAAAMIEADLARTAKQQFDAAAVSNARLANYGVYVKLTAFRKAPAGLYKEPSIIVRGWLELPHKLLARSGTQIVESLREKYQGHSVRKDFMSRRLHWAQSKHLRSMLAHSGVPTKPADCQTLSRVRIRLQDHYNPPEYEICKAEIKFANDGSHIIWNGERYSVFLNSGVPTIKRLGKRIAISAIRRILGSE